MIFSIVLQNVKRLTRMEIYLSLILRQQVWIITHRWANIKIAGDMLKIDEKLECILSWQAVCLFWDTLSHC